VANREGKGAIKRRRMTMVILQNSANPPGADHKVQLVALSEISAIIALEPSSLELPAFEAPQKILRRGARSRLRAMLCAALIVSSVAELVALSGLSL